MRLSPVVLLLLLGLVLPPFLHAETAESADEKLTIGGSLDLTVEALTRCPSVDLLAEDYLQRTPLHYSAAQNNFALGTVLIETALRVHSPLDVNAPDANKETPAHIAHRCRNTEGEQMLRRIYGADGKARNILGQKPDETNAKGDPSLAAIFCKSPAGP